MVVLYYQFTNVPIFKSTFDVPLYLANESSQFNALLFFHSEIFIRMDRSFYFSWVLHLYIVALFLSRCIRYCCCIQSCFRKSRVLASRCIVRISLLFQFLLRGQSATSFSEIIPSSSRVLSVFDATFRDKNFFAFCTLPVIDARTFVRSLSETEWGRCQQWKTSS